MTKTTVKTRAHHVRRNLTGQRFGRLIAITARGTKSPYSWGCVCDCGNIVFVKSVNLCCGGTTSCGCLGHPNHRLPDDKGIFNYRRNLYRDSAKKRGLPFNLTDEEITILFAGNCVYCGCPPSQKFKSRKMAYGYGELIYNGIDRLNSKLGYVHGNVVSCCGTCNNAKSDMDENEFIAWLNKVAKYLGIGTNKGDA